ncbi:MAG: prepilin-type N-terminal cleavage/methylation domain-containing protein [Candidatus Andersenbacteria bacterium]|nr:prepilin-type N-terminal cleavage/methylation domain-containing protein [bacterium]MDZ4225300.1 prepilin-type N-terminal cleavage/methylation domain-containing protein [Candidatus Andersenbacteria bacterium]
MRGFNWEKRIDATGFSLIEFLIVIAIGALLIVAMVMFVGFAFNISRRSFEQAKTTEDARLQIERVADIIRNSRPIDCDGDGYTDDTLWLSQVDPYSIEVISNVDGDSAPEKVRYYIDEDSTNLMRQVTEDACSGTASDPEVIARTVRNRTVGESKAVFVYYNDAGVQTIDPAQVARVEIDLVIDFDINQPPSPFDVKTSVTIRSEICAEGMCEGLVCEQSGGIFLPDAEPFFYNYDDDFVAPAFSACLNYCDYHNTPPDGCCNWSVGFEWDGTTVVDAYCNCKGASIPSGLEVQDVAGADDYASLYRDCWNGTWCGNGVSGRPFSKSPSCGDASGVPGQFACWCPQ